MYKLLFEKKICNKQKKKTNGSIHCTSLKGGLCYICVLSVGGFLLAACHLSAFSVTWRKNNVELRSDAFHVVKAEGERHSLLIKQMRPSGAGSYCVTAVNAAGTASCSARLYIQSGEARAEIGGRPTPSRICCEA